MLKRLLIRLLAGRPPAPDLQAAVADLKSAAAELRSAAADSDVRERLAQASRLLAATVAKVGTLSLSASLVDAAARLSVNVKVADDGAVVLEVVPQGGAA